MSNDKKNTDDLIGGLCDDLEPMVPRCPYRNISIWLIASVAYIVGVIYYLGLKVNLEEQMSSAPFIFEMGMAASILIVSALASSWLSFPDSIQRSWIKIIASTLFATFLFFIIANGIEEGGDFTLQHFFLKSCSRGIIVDAIPFIVLIYMTFRGQTTQPYWSMAMNVMAASALGWIGLRLTCGMYESMTYGFINYLLPFIILGAVMGLFARKLFKW